MCRATQLDQHLTNNYIKPSNMTTYYDATYLVSRVLPWPCAIYRDASSNSVIVRDLVHNLETRFGIPELRTPESAARIFAETLRDYRLLLDAWHGRHAIVWS